MADPFARTCFLSQIHNAARNPVPLDMNQARAVEARMDLDLRTGAALTRIQTMKLQQAFPGVLENVISYGAWQECASLFFLPC